MSSQLQSSEIELEEGETGLSETRLRVREEDDNDQSSPPQSSEVSYLVMCSVCLLGLAILAVPLIIVAILIVLIYIVALPVLILSFLVTRALQILWHGDDYNQAVQLKLFIRSLMFLVTSLLAAGLGILYGIVKLIPGFERALFWETPLDNWINLLFVIYGIYMLHWVLSVCVFKFVPNIPLHRYESGYNAPENVLEIIACLNLLLILSQVEHRVPAFKAGMILGLHTRKWIQVMILVFLAYNGIVLLTRVIIAYEVLATKCLKLFGIKGLPVPEEANKKLSEYNLIMQKIMRVRYVKYCAVGVKHSIDFILTSLAFLLTWELYFRSQLQPTPQAERVLHVGTISCVTLLLCAILWFVKTYFLLLWEIRAIYNRLENKIVKGATQLYFLGILGSRNHDIFKIRNDDDDNNNTNDEGQEGGYIRACLSLFPVWDNKSLSCATRKILRADLLIKEDTSPSFYRLQQMAYYFLQARETLKDDRYTSCVMDDLKQWIKVSRLQDSANIGDGFTNKEELSKLTEDLLPKQKKQEEEANDENDGETQEKPDYWKCFDEQMSEYVDSSSAERREECYSLEQIEMWMVRARNNCLFLANTLSSAKQLVRCLNNIISLLIVAATFIFWLLLTGFANTRVLVFFGSPLLAASFIFGDTCKTLFQGFVFVYVVHPFHVGDFCIIDEYMLEVRTIGIWITTFSRVDTRDEVIYPNSTLLDKTITNHKINFDWNDHLEFEVCSVNSKTKDLKEYVEEYFKKSKTFIASLVVVVRAENVIKIAVTYKSSKDMKNSTYSQCLEEKQMLKSKLLDDLQDIVEKNTITC